MSSTEVHFHPNYVRLREAHTLLKITWLLNSGRVKDGASFGGPVISLYWISQLAERKNLPYSECVHFWFSLLKFFYLCSNKQFRREIRKLDTIFKGFPPINILFVSILQVTTCHASVNRIKESPNESAQHFLLLHKIIIFLALFRDPFKPPYLLILGPLKCYSTLSGQWCIKFW